MIHDAKVEATCDEDGCHESVQLEPKYVYASMSGAGGHYDTSERALNSLLENEGWTVVDDKTYCESHAPEDNDEDEEDDVE